MFVEALFDFGLVLHNLSVIYVLATNDEIEQFWSLGRPYADSGGDITHISELLIMIGRKMTYSTSEASPHMCQYCENRKR